MREQNPQSWLVISPRGTSLSRASKHSFMIPAAPIGQADVCWVEMDPGSAIVESTEATDM